MRKTKKSVADKEILKQYIQKIRDQLVVEEKDEYSKYKDDPVKFGFEILNHKYTRDVSNMMMSVVNNRTTLAKSSNGTGKSYAVGDLAIWALLVFNDSQVYLTATPYSNLQNILWPKVAANVLANKELFGEFGKLTDDGIESKSNPEHFIRPLTIPTQGSETEKQGKFSGKHAPHLFFFVDESDTVPEFVFNGIESCMSGTYDRLLCTFNPRCASGRMYQLERSGGANVVMLRAFTHPNVVTGKDIIPGAVSRTITVQRINRYCRPINQFDSMGIDTFELPKCLVGATVPLENNEKEFYPPLKEGLYKIEDSLFYHIVLAEYPSQSTNQLIAQEWIDRAISRWEEYRIVYGDRPPDVYGIAGLDAAEMGADANAMCFRYGDWVDKIRTWGGMDALESGDRAMLELSTRKIRNTNVDGIGYGSGIAPYMVRMGTTATSVKVSESPTKKMEEADFGNMRDQLWWEVREWFRSDKAMIPPDEELRQELITATYEIPNGKIKIMQKKDMKILLHRSPDRADALCLTFAKTENIGWMGLN